MSKQVLVVDDSMLVRQHVGRCLRAAGFQIVEATDGVDALSKISAETAMMICDVNMPQMSGIELLEALRADERYVNVPILMLTTEGQSQMLIRAKQLGIKGWMLKPFKPEILVSAVRLLTT